MDGFIGGDTDLVSAAGNDLVRAAARLHSTSGPVRGAGSTASAAAGNGSVRAAVDRCVAAWARMLSDLATQVDAVGLLADVGAEDLARAGS